VTDPVDVKALAETVRRGLGAGDRLMPGTMSEEEHLAGIALDALLAEVDRGRREFARLQNEYEFDVAIPMDEQREHIERAEADVERLRVALQDVQGIALNGTDTADTNAERLDAIDLRATEALAAAAGSPAAWVCPSCGTSWAERLLVGAIGCPECGSVAGDAATGPN